MHGSVQVHRPAWDDIILCCKDMDIVWEEIGRASPSCNLKSKIPRQGWHSLSPRLTSVVLWLLPRPDCRAKAMPPWKLHILFYSASSPTEDLFWVSKDSVGFSCFILPITSTDVFSCQSWKQTFKMFREDSFKSRSEWIGRHTTRTCSIQQGNEEEEKCFCCVIWCLAGQGAAEAVLFVGGRPALTHVHHESGQTTASTPLNSCRCDGAITEAISCDSFLYSPSVGVA